MAARALLSLACCLLLSGCADHTVTGNDVHDVLIQMGKKYELRYDEYDSSKNNPVVAIGTLSDSRGTLFKFCAARSGAQAEPTEVWRRCQRVADPEFGMKMRVQDGWSVQDGVLSDIGYRSRAIADPRARHAYKRRANRAWEEFESRILDKAPDAEWT